jgi:type I restriction enzyme, S subunit
MMKIKLKKIAKVLSGSTAPKDNEFSENNGKPFIRAGHLEELCNGKSLMELPKIEESVAQNRKMVLVPENTILFAKSGMSILKNRVYKTTHEAYIVNHLAAIICSNEIEPDYLYYFFRANPPSRLVLDSSYPSIRLSDIGEIDIDLPSKAIQKKISKLLKQAEEIIFKRKAQIEALDQLTQSVFLEVFGDPATNPKKWPMGFIKDLALKTQYGTSKKASEDTGKYPILRMNNITYEGHWDLTDLKYVDLDDKEVEKYLVHKGELLFNRTNSKELVGKTAVYRFEKPMAFAGYLVKLIPNEKANAEFISAYLNSKYGKSILFSMAKNIVGMANINAEELKSIKIYIPPKQLQDQFAEIVQKIESQRELFKKGLVELEKNFNSLMQRVFKGELFND